MTKVMEYDLVAIGGGTAGLVSAAGAAYLGARPALIEKEALGGDCLWTGCVPSKSLLASARLAHAMGDANRLGLTDAAPGHPFSQVMERMRRARDQVAHHDDPERFRKMGVAVHFGTARFVSPDTVEVEGVGRIRSKRFVVATGARPAIPPIPGLEEAGYLTHEVAFDQDELPDPVVILGAGPIGVEFSQIYSRMGARVTVLEMESQILPAEDPDVAAALRDQLEAEGIEVVTGLRATGVEVDPETGEKVVQGDDGRGFPASEVFVATGRKPHTEDLDLERAGVALTDGGAVKVDEKLRTSASTVWAAGDVTGGLQFTHVADQMARVALRNSLLPFSKKLDLSVVPWVTYTDPEVAHVGLGQAEAERKGGRTYTYPFDDLDRSIAEAESRGFVKISADGKGKIMGATIVGHSAGDLLMPVVMAMKHDISLSGLSDIIWPYPTRAEGIKRAADAYQRTRLDGFGGRILKKVVQWLA